MSKLKPKSFRGGRSTCTTHLRLKQATIDRHFVAEPVQRPEASDQLPRGFNPWFSLTLVLFILSTSELFAQATNYDRNTPAFRQVERMEILSGSVRNDLFLDVAPIDRRYAAQFLHGLDSIDIRVMQADNYWGGYIFRDNQPWAKQVGIEVKKKRKKEKKPENFLQHFYRDKANFLSVNDSDFRLYVNPVLCFSGGRQGDSSGILYRNTRGIEIRGLISNKLGFYTYVADNQAGFPNYTIRSYDSTRVLPGESYVKHFKSGQSLDFLTARGYISFSPIRRIQMQFGHGRNFIGSGYRSLLLSDFAADYLHLRINTQVWRLHYQNIFAQMTDFVPTQPKPYPRKYAAFHYLSLDAAKWLNIGLFEGVVFFDSKGDGRGFDPVYLSPIVFYRWAEQTTGSGDNAVMGANMNMIFARQFKVYGQLMLDDLKFSELKENTGWWGNKVGWQAGLKWVNILGLPNIDWQTEYNRVRPYTYTSDSPSKSYVHYNQPLAHPLGANFSEWINILNINPWGPLHVRLKYMAAVQGRDTGSANLGANILRSNKKIFRTHDNEILQGMRTTIRHAEMTVTYMPLHNLFLDGTVLYRTEKNEVRAYDTFFFGVGLRLNFYPPDYTF